MSSQLDRSAPILGDYMLKGWTLTDRHCDRCNSTPLMREPAYLAERAGRDPIQFCALCDGGPQGRTASEREPVAPSSASATSLSSYMTAEYEDAASSIHEHAGSSAHPSTPPVHSPRSATSPMTPSRRRKADEVSDAIGDLMLKGYSLLGDSCPNPECEGVPLVGNPRRPDGTRDGRRQCVSCGAHFVDEKDLERLGMLPHGTPKAKPASVQQSTVFSPTISTAGHAAAKPAIDTMPLAKGEQPESPRTKARREMYAVGEAINIERAAAIAAASTPPTPTPTTMAAPSSSLIAEPNGEAPSAPVGKDLTPRIPRGRVPFAAADHRPALSDGKLRVVVIATGSVASIKIPNIVDELSKDRQVLVQVVATKAATHFFDKDLLEKKYPGVSVWTDEDEWSDWKKIGDPILHIELRRWADLVVIAPTSADMLSKIAAGLCDNLPLSLLRALAPTTPVVLCPAMNTNMYEHAHTARHLAFAREVLGYHILGPQGAGLLACGDAGSGKMTEWTDIVKMIRGYAAAFSTAPEKSHSATLQRLITEIEQPADGATFVITSPKGSMGRSAGKRHSRKKSSDHKHKHGGKHRPKSELGQKRPPSMWSKIFGVPASLLRIFFFPFLLLLHIIFTLSSIVLRVVQAQPSSPVELTKPAPQHLALILVPGNGARRVVADRYVESVRRAVQWSAEWGVTTISIWDGKGLGMTNHSAVTAGFLDLPLSPPSSRPATPPRTSLDIIPPAMGNDTITSTVNVITTSGQRRVEVHFLAPSAADAIAQVTQGYIMDGVSPDEIQQDLLDRAIMDVLHLPSDPELAIIHQLSPPGFWRGLLPRPAPELWGYPPWALRITEIYSHPPTLPLYVPFVGSLLHNSHLPILRKIGAAFPAQGDIGVLDADEWDGAQSSWEKVEQRRGK